MFFNADCRRTSQASLFVVVCAVICFVAVPAATAGAWTPKKRATYMKLAANHFRGEDMFDRDGREVERNSGIFEDSNLSLYFETGLTNRFAVFGTLVYKEISNEIFAAGIHSEIENSGFSDAELGVRYNLLSGSHVLSVAGLMKLPYFYDDEDFFGLGASQEDYELRLLYGKGFSGWYLGAEAGYRFRASYPADEYRYLLEAGFNLTSRFYFRTKLDGTLSAGDGDPFFSANPTLSAEFDLTRWELTAGSELWKDLGLEYSYVQDIDGENIVSGEIHQLGLVYKF